MGDPRPVGSPSAWATFASCARLAGAAWESSYEAEQESLGRHVALKLLPSHALLDPRHLQRFLREARAAARLHHTNIVPVFGVGEQDGLHYYVMQFITGSGSRRGHRRAATPEVSPTSPQPRPGRAPRRPAASDEIAQGLLTGSSRRLLPTWPTRPTPPAVRRCRPPRTSLPGVRSCRDRAGTSPRRSRGSVSRWPRPWVTPRPGGLHRDIKPSNLLLDVQGTVWVTDFGLAKAMADSDNLTNDGDILGTLRYMAPERFRGQSDIRSDLYALGLTLYELLTLRPASTRTTAIA